MTTASERARVDVGVGIVTVLVGTGFLVLAWNIDAYSDDAVGPKAVPMAIALGMMALGALIGLKGVLASMTPAADSKPLLQPGVDDGTSESFGFRGSNLVRIAFVIGSGAAFVVAFHGFGYFVATALALLLALLAFGNRETRLLVAVPLIGAAAYQFIFMHMMGLHDPAGAWIDVQALLARFR